MEEYAGRAKRSASVISRHLLDIGDRNRKGEPGLGLVTSRPNPNNRRRLEYLLTPKGRALAKQIKLALERIQEEMRSVSKSSGEATKPPPSPDLSSSASANANNVLASPTPETGVAFHVAADARKALPAHYQV